MKSTGTIQFPDFVSKPAFVIGPKSYQSDRFTAACDIILLPARTSKGETFHCSIQSGTTKNKSAVSNKNYFKSIFPTKIECIKLKQKIVLDMRVQNPHNWAHFTECFFPAVFCIIHSLQIKIEDLVVVFPESFSKDWCKLFSIFNIEFILTNNDIQCDYVKYDPKIILPQSKLMRQVIFDTFQIPQVINKQPSSTQFPKKLFVSRKDSRVISNEIEVYSTLEKMGFMKIYAEDFNSIDQIKFFQEAECVVATHGAALGSMFYTKTDHKNLNYIVEFQPIGHSVPVFQNIANLCDVYWIGVRGKMKKAYVEGVYDLSQPFLRYSGDHFEVEISALEYAISMAEVKQSYVFVN